MTVLSGSRVYPEKIANHKMKRQMNIAQAMSDLTKVKTQEDYDALVKVWVDWIKEVHEKWIFEKVMKLGEQLLKEKEKDDKIGFGQRN